MLHDDNGSHAATRRCAGMPSRTYVKLFVHHSNIEYTATEPSLMLYNDVRLNCNLTQGMKACMLLLFYTFDCVLLEDCDNTEIFKRRKFILMNFYHDTTTLEFFLTNSQNNCDL
jgi:hypothetical protein